MRPLFALFFVALLAGCQGSIPPSRGDGRLGYGAILVQGRVATPAGETRRARVALNLESDDHRYIIPFTPGTTSLFVVPAGTYRLMPLRGPFGVTEKTLQIVIENRVLRVPFPRDVLRKDPLEVGPDRIVPIGVLNVDAERDPGDRRVSVKIKLDDGRDARRRLVQDKISSMMDARVPAAQREEAINWTKALDQALVAVEADPDERAPYKPRSR
ncbi:MAG: hypothetical protein HY925_08880 [Elusimicrobia bacterium]|nr:hypothetical protein [Elusimicrobiota bacterium]